MTADVTAENPDRPCSRAACNLEAIATLSYVYAESVAVLGPLSFNSEPHSYDLCKKHAARTTVPAGWQIIRHPDTVASIN